ncbi:hypothetical protein G4B88_019133 [Cannabis sativa]|uniref:Reverse transcriptase zinc-binding domain-containing protein n=1 Tax=Cannabis sativa TaxID=3483 RepID=A0A7J6HM94_CANSA|nr:hypothetical protein G4B88_019133 [Cannabis sativa]
MMIAQIWELRVKRKAGLLELDERAAAPLRDSNFWNSSIPSSASWGARGIFATHDLIRRESCWLVGNGQNVDIWSSPWVPWLAWDFYEAAFNPMIWGSELLYLDQFVNLDRSLNLGDLSIWFKPDFLEQLGRLSFLPPGSHDSLVWKSSLDRSFSVKSAYTAIIECRKGDLDVLFQQLWKTPFSERVKLFMWKVGKDILPCGQRLYAMFGNTSCCVLCENAEDLLEHLFLHCHMARYCWFKTSLCYTLWNVRNKTFHDKLIATPESIFQTVMKSVRETRDCVASSGSLLQPTVVPGLDRLWTGGGEGDEAFSVKISAGSPLEGETLAIFHAISRCISCNWSRVSIFSDCKVAVDAVLARKIPNWKISLVGHSGCVPEFCGLFSDMDVFAAMNSN